MANVTGDLGFFDEWSFNGSNGTNYSVNVTLDGGGGELSFENLYPVLLQTFVVIVLGYVFYTLITLLESVYFYCYLCVY